MKRWCDPEGSYRLGGGVRSGRRAPSRMISGKMLSRWRGDADFDETAKAIFDGLR
ncbi:hypothetical protein GCM10017559_02260 [Streptosporangium longisporum]|uniref:Uncharacterized protein n=1 Tax=Streptosporangium longisporum TaxID=46187 RepID=A0ABN3XPR6_9ACTN